MRHARFGWLAFVPLLATPLQAQQIVALPKQTRELNETLPQVWTVGREEGQSWELLSNVTSVAFDRQLTDNRRWRWIGGGGVGGERRLTASQGQVGGGGSVAGALAVNGG